MTTRIGSLALVTDTLRDVASSQTTLATLQQQISSGMKSQNFQGLNGSVEQYTQVTSELNRATQFNTNNTLNISKLNTADTALSTITDIADQMKNLMVASNGATITTNNVPQAMGDLITSMMSQLNVTFNGVYMFGGTDTTNPPVTQAGLNAIIPGVASPNYYSGSQDDQTIRADDTTTMAFPVRADDPAFQQILAAAKLAITAAQTGDTTTMETAQQMIQTGQSALISVRSTVGSTSDNITAVNNRLQQQTTYWQQLSDGDAKTDIVAASTQVSSYQAILQASFQVYARLSQLSIVDYLK
jgi:flagellar hook-associated protein 3 FlgL